MPGCFQRRSWQKSYSVFDPIAKATRSNWISIAAGIPIAETISRTKGLSLWQTERVTITKDSSGFLPFFRTTYILFVFVLQGDLRSPHHKVAIDVVRHLSSIKAIKLND
jgi:hypothetical protein